MIAVLAVAPRALAQETIAEIRIHGNHTTPDTDVVGLSGLKTGDSASDARLAEAQQMLQESGRFADVEVRRRFRSIDNPSDILVIILVDEHAGVSDDDLTPGAGTRLREAAQWLPILNYADGYGLTYGVRVAFADAAGPDSRLSVPLSWGGERRVGVELERSFNDERTRVGAALWLNRRVNPFFEVPDRRRQLRLEAEQSIANWLKVGASGRVAHVELGDDYTTRHTAAGAHVTLDTRIDPSFPRNAIHTRIGWERLGFTGGPDQPSLFELRRSAVALAEAEDPRLTATSAGRWLADARGYLGIGGSTVLALRGQLARSDSPLPHAEQSLLGGGDSLRGYDAGHRAGDNMAAVSAEVRVPLNSPLSSGIFGVKGFIDAGTTWASGERMSDQRFERGIGGGVYMGAAVFILNLDVAWPEEGNPRVHFGLGVSF
ncbi:MAG TPA: FtsQ-type POTRA domain-containing protein [Vicinamibacterales bacterium]|nr:FtsQ-type POTRA domain-containing protein [Vicinamibacterales bacterium]